MPLTIQNIARLNNDLIYAATRASGSLIVIIWNKIKYFL
jgi:hypothetical protein